MVVYSFKTVMVLLTAPEHNCKKKIKQTSAVYYYS